MQTLLVTVIGQPNKKSFDLELPGDLPISDLLPFLLELCGLQEETAELSEAELWCLRLDEQTTALQRTHTLIDAGALDGAILYLQTLASLEVSNQPKKSIETRQIVPGPGTGGIGVRWSKGDLNF
ncbi:hypothetical protein KDA_35380 [Dictyobacter alpinus]|uniref:Uncharacterized protein n=1 Tax=Dictyobacter alpinus TaxID=2014873 RepID=A0A402B9K5_9CHLR|nr:EsaB/YukD family protein [Dictyobacter alpinus]GCE28054.1 hypothetical protein KDA_35380 [Dictyobacter alpinus]